MRKDLTGLRFNRWLVVKGGKKVQRQDRNSYIEYWVCVCDCGTTREVRTEHLKSGASKSCGCWRKEMPRIFKATHGKSRASICNVWCCMKARCENPNNNEYKNYGGRGIMVCEHWNKFENFYADMGDKPKGMTIERINNNKGYFSGNCKWATQKEQNRNTRVNRVICYQGEVKCLAAWAEKLNINYSTLKDRLKRHSPGIAFNM